ncbi:MAG: ABC transporter substrate-binding protein, partial [Roseiflexaceae bacterium]|nr:ABC transporter substrate-binding protein [Roseiflexaceae bacterium]
MQPVTRAIGIGYLLICLLVLLATAFIGPVGYAPFPLPIGPAQTPVVVTIWYGTEKKLWLEDAAQRF